MQTTSFSLAFVFFKRYRADGKGAFLGALERAVMLEVPGAAPEVITTNGGASQFPSAARAGRRSGEAKISANQCPMWAKALGMGGVISVTGAQNMGDVSPVQDNVGATMSASLVVAADETAKDAVVTVEVTEAATQAPNATTAKAKVTIYSSNGEVEVLQGVSLALQPPVQPNLPSIGVGISRAAVAAATPAFKVGDTGYFTVYAPRTGRESLKLDNNPAMNYVSLEGRTLARPDSDDFTGTIKIAKAFPSGFTPSEKDNEATSGMELALTCCAVPGGTPIEFIHDQTA